MDAFKPASQRCIRKHMHLAALALALLTSNCDGFTTAPASSRSHSLAAATQDIDVGDGSAEQSRRSVLSSFLTTAVAATAGASVLFPSEAFAEAETLERGGVKLTPFNSLAFNYRGGESPTIDPSAIGEDSIPYSDFLDKLNSDQVEFVEFLAPNGDAAYATFKSSSGEGETSNKSSNNKPIRIGEGYPVEDPEGWSSPAFVIKAVAKKGVPYKFVVPGLGDSFKQM
ncbi:hypothetical protein ACHAXR_001996 [Thalassiosira sp. AJA248-18]